MTDQVETPEAQYILATDGVGIQSGFPGRAHARNRRGPLKRVLLIVGPFILLLAAVALSAGIVELVEAPPVAKTALTPAEPLAAPAGTAVLDASTEPPALPEDRR